MKISFYGCLGEIIGRQIERPAAPTVALLRTALAEAFPEAADHLVGNRVRIAVDHRFVGDNWTLSGDEQVDFLPPLSGG